MGRISKLIFSCIAAIIVQTAYAQTIKLSGNITDKQGIAIDMATVVVKDSTGKIITGCTSDSLGYFAMEVMPQAYSLHISCVGYADYTHQIGGKSVFVNAVLDDAAINLGEVAVTAKTPLIRREIDRVVLNAEKLNAISTNFMDVLKHMPGVIVQDDNISMLNKGKIIFLMNGREMKMDIKGLFTYLSSLPSDNLKQIEVMTTPPAKYSAEGNAGVINFVTKKLENNYFGGYVANRLSIKERVYDGANLSLQYKHNRLEAYVNTGVGFGTIQSESKRCINYTSEIWNTTNRKFKSNDYVLGTAGADYVLTKNSSVGGILSYINMQPDADDTSKTTILPAATNSRSRYFETTTDFNSNYNRYNANLHYVLNNIGNGGLLNVNADYLNYTINDHVDLQTTHDEDMSYLNSPKTMIDIYQGKADMEMPIGHCIMSYGAAYSQSKTDNRTDYERMSTGQDLSDYFVYRESIFAAYSDVKYKFSDHWNLKFGVRGEYAKLDGNSIKMNNRTVKHLFDVFPTAYVNYSWSDYSALSLSVSSRINRPSYVDINPFTTYNDAHTVTTGNPNLLPEKSYTAELGYALGNFSLSTSVMWKSRVISSYTSIDKTQKLTTMTVDNVMKKQMYSLDASYYFDKILWLDCDIEGSVYKIVSKPMAGYNLEKTNNTSVFLYMNNNFYFNQRKTLMATLWGQYQSKEKDVVGESSSRYRVDLGFKWLLMGKRLSIGVECQNLLASHAKSIVKSEDATYVFDRTPYRVANLTVSYRFGKKLNVQQKKFGIDSGRL
ncbi:TonB-dependent receptor domain-containing protein [uncultured Bacteroides sp.]|uniref:TonB-dependent receptor domain-containing protein n=1 Tax=uncultured Bacteroides sp. TaxID=162156 RepID=UPI002AAAE1EC|nr:TonB-dependent receptor [uncultured Bacteroides sp.]